jgi:preprotein translocase subunit YajC
VSILSFQNVQPSPGAGVTVTSSQGATPSAPASGQAAGSPLITLLPFVLILPFFFMMFRRNKKEDQARSHLKKGDRIVSTSGLVGELVEMDERFAKVKLSPGNTVTMLKTSISPLDPAPASSASAKGDDNLKDLKDAKAATGDKK